MHNPAPDPVLLLARAASNYLKRHGNGILPVCVDDEDDSENSDDSANYVISFHEEAKIRGWPQHVSKSDDDSKLCIAEVGINVEDRDYVDTESLSEDEY